MNNKLVKRVNFRKFRHASMCGCRECVFKDYPLRDYSVVYDEDLVDEDGWI